MSPEGARPLRDASGLRLGAIAGVEIRVAPSLAIIFVMILVSLGAGVFPSWHPDWSPALVWSTALLASILFFASVLAHELSHALVGRTQGVPIRRITLFLFGGVAHMESHPEGPRAELLMAIVGPLTSALIGLGALALGSWLAGIRAIAGDFATSPSAVLGHVGPIATLLLWLGPINLVLAIFNLVPGFPLDGGRVLRALLWWGTGDLERATRWASWVGQLVAWALIAIGIYDVVQGHMLQGLWLVLIGWFLDDAARRAYQDLVMKDALESVPISKVMRTHLEPVPAHLSVEVFVRDHLMKSGERVFPVEQDGRSVGFVALEDVRGVPEERWATATVGEIMVPVDALPALSPQASAEEALEALSSKNVELVPVVEGGRVLGLVDLRDLFKWLALRPPRARTA